MVTETEWRQMFKDCGAFWSHDRNPQRPYARLTSGKISDGFFNAGRIPEEDPHVFGLACTALWRTASERGVDSSGLRILGAAMGGVSLSNRIAEVARCKSGFAEKSGDALVFERPQICPGERFLLIEDTITTGGTIRKLRAAAEKASPGCTFENVILAVCNRSGLSKIDGVPILALISPTIQSWDEGKNPFTENGKEFVEPVKPKANWERLTGSYA